MERVTIADVGEFIDRQTIRNPRRDARAVIGRLIEEITELAVEARMPAGKIFEHVTDALANEARKFQHNIVYPSELTTATDSPPTIQDILNEAADVSLVLRDLLHILRTNDESFIEIERRKWNAFTQHKFKVSKSGCLYAIKNK